MQGPVKVCFAAVRTVVFDTLRKFDGRQFRELLPGEYTQMAGRAGRRGLDKIGTVVTMCRDEILEESVLKNIINGNVKKLESQFRLTFIMILHLLRVEELKVEDMLKRSFAEFHAQTKLPEQQRLLMIKRAQSMKTIECIKGEPGIEEYYDLYSKAKEYDSQILGTVMHFFEDKKIVCGRVVIVKSSSAHNHLLGVIVRSPSSSSEQYIVLVLRLDLPPTMQTNPPSGILENKESGDFSKCELLVPKSKRAFVADYNSFSSGRRAPGPVNIKIRLPHTGTAAGVRYEVRGIDKKEFLSICACKLTIDEAGLLQDVSIHAYAKTVQDLLKLRSTGNNFPPTLDPVKELKVKDPETVDAYKKSNLLLSKMSENKCHGCVKLEEHIKWATEIKNHKKDLSELEFQMSDEALQQMPDFYYRMEVLKDIGCVDSELMVQIKGRVACEMNSAEELICTECLFENQLDDLDPEEAVALMSALVFQQKKASQPSLTPKLSKATTRLYNTAIKLGEIQKGFGIQIEPDEYARENLKFGLVEVVYEWAKGTPFSDICELTDVPEGLIVRTIVRLDETCREFKNASAIMGNTALCNKMEVASNAIRRDIVFAASLYVTGI